jgi:hypothetical protein
MFDQKPHQDHPHTTPSGRAVSALNHLTHGGTSQTLFLKDEDPDEFFSLLEDAFKYHSPTNSQDSGLVTDTVLARWFLIRRQQTHMYYEAKLHERKPLSTYWVQPDLHELNLFDRYKTQAERALTRALNNVRHIRKDALAENHWQAQHELQKERFALQRERFELAKRKEVKEDPPEPEIPPPAPVTPEVPKREDIWVDQFGSSIPQDVYVTVEDGVTRIFDLLPTNAEVQQIIDKAEDYPYPPTEVIRMYMFSGRIPPEYEWLITEPWQRKAQNLKLTKSLSFEQWRNLAASEEKRPAKVA